MPPIHGPLDYNGYPPRRRTPPSHTRDAPAERIAQPDADAEFEAWLQGERREQPISRRGRLARSRSHLAAQSRARLAKHSDNRPHAQEGQEEVAHEDTGHEDTAHAEHAPLPVKRRGRQQQKPAPLPTAPRPIWKKLRKLAICLVVLAVGELIVAALTAPQFAVKAVDVSGLNVTPDDRLRPIAASLLGQNFFRADVRAAARQASAIPAIRHAAVARVLQWPPRLTLRVEERQPFARLASEAGDWWVVDRDGVPFRPVGQEDMTLPAVSARALHPALGRQLPPLDWEPVVRLAQALQADAGKGGEWSLRRIYFDRHGRASLRLQGGPHNETLVRLGGADWPAKLLRARQSLAYLTATRQCAQVLDLVSYKRTVWTPRPTPEPDKNAALAAV